MRSSAQKDFKEVQAMRLLQQYIDCMKRGDDVALADIFNDTGVLHDTSLLKIDKDILHLEGKMAVEMMFHHKFGFNGGPFPITNVVYCANDNVRYFIEYGDLVIPVTAYVSELDPEGKILRLDIYPL